MHASERQDMWRSHIEGVKTSVRRPQDALFTFGHTGKIFCLRDKDRGFKPCRAQTFLRRKESGKTAWASSTCNNGGVVRTEKLGISGPGSHAHMGRTKRTVTPRRKESGFRLSPASLA